MDKAPVNKLGHTTLFAHMYGLLLGPAETASAVAAFACTGGHGPDAAAFWECLFMLRVEEATLLSMLRSLPAPLDASQQGTVRLIFSRSVESLADPNVCRKKNSCLTLQILFDHVLAERRLKYVEATAAICGAAESDAFFSLLLHRLYAILAGASSGAELQHQALRTILTLATAEANISANPIFARLLEASFQPVSATGDTKQDLAVGREQSSGVNTFTGVNFFTAVLPLFTAPASPPESAAIGPDGGAAQGISTVYPHTKCMRDYKGYPRCMQPVQAHAALLLVLAAHYQRGECHNPFLEGINALGPRDVRCAATPPTHPTKSSYPRCACCTRAGTGTPVYTHRWL
jgi:hypothetical protein